MCMELSLSTPANICESFLCFVQSQSPEEPPSPGVLGRIGSWLSPWRAKGPESPTENASSRSDEALGTAGEEENPRSVSTQARERQREEEKGQSPDTSQLRLPADIFPCEEDATQSARRDGPIVASSKPEEGGPTEEEFVEKRKKRKGPGIEREESSNGTSLSGSPVSDKNASHLTHLSYSSEQGVVRDSVQAHTQRQAQRQTQVRTGRELHVFLEETSLIQRGKDTRAGPAVICTKVTKSFQVIPKSPGPYGAAVSLKSHKKPEDSEQVDGSNMVRKNTARRKSRKNSQGDAGSSSQESTSTHSSAQTVPEGLAKPENSMTKPQGKSQPTHAGKPSVNSSSTHTPASQASPEGGQSRPAALATAKQLDNIQGSNSAIEPAVARVVDGGADMEDDDSIYKVERKTETAESKRRSIKVSRSEVKLFSKNVHLKADQSKGEDNKGIQDTKEEAKEQAKQEIKSRHREGLKKVEEEPQTVAARIADRISLFEQHAVGTSKIFKTPRSADVSPARTRNERLKAEFGLSDLRSRSAERFSEARSVSVSPVRGKQMTVKERAMNFADGGTTQSQKSVTTGMSQNSPASAAAAGMKPPELENQGKQDCKELTQITVKSEITSEPDGRDATALKVNNSAAKQPPVDSKTKGPTLSSEAEDQCSKLETESRVKGDSSELTSDVCPQSKSLGRTGSRSKRRKSRESVNPISPNSESKSDQSTSKQEVIASQQEVMAKTQETAAASTQLTETTASDKTQSTSDKKSLSDTKQPERNTALEAAKKPLDSSIMKETNEIPVNGKERSSEPSVRKRDEPDTGSKKLTDKKSVVLAEEERAGGQKHLLAEERKSKDSLGMSPSISSPPGQQIMEEAPLVKPKPPVEHPKVDAQIPRQAETKLSKEKVKQPEPVKKVKKELNQAEEKKKVLQSQQTETHQAGSASKEETQQLSPSVKHNTQAKTLDRGQCYQGAEGSVARDDARENTEKKEETKLVKDTAALDSSQAKPACPCEETTVGSSDFPAGTPPASQTDTANPVCVVTHTNDATGTANCDKRPTEPLQGETAPNVPELQAESTERPGTETQPAVKAEEPQPKFVAAGKTENSTDDSQAHGAHDVELSILKPVTKTTVAAEEMAVKVINDSPVQIDKEAAAESSGSSVKEPIPVSDSISKSLRDVASRDAGSKSSVIKLVVPEVEISGAVAKEGSKHTESIIDPVSLKATGNASQIVLVNAASVTSSTDKVGINGDLTSQPKSLPLSSDLGNKKPNQGVKRTEAPKQIPDSVQRSLDKFNLPLSTQQDTPSSWLDVDVPKRRLRPPEPKLSSSGSENNLLDTPGEWDDDDFVQRIKALCAPFSLPPRKHNHLRPPQPPFVMPAIREDRFEKPFDPDEFKFGLRRKKQLGTDSAPGLLAKLQAADVKGGLKAARASLVDRSMLLNTMDVHSRLREKVQGKDDETEEREEKKDEPIKVKSRLEGSCVLSILSASNLRGKKNGASAHADGTSSENVSPTEAPQLSPPPLSQPPPPSPTATSPINETPAKQGPTLNGRVGALDVAEAVVSDSGPPLPSFNDFKLPDYLEKYLPRELPKPVQSAQGDKQANKEVIERMSAPLPGDGGDLDVKAGLSSPPQSPGIPPTTHRTLPELQQPPDQPQAVRTDYIRTPKGFHKRPGKMVLFEEPLFGGQAYEVCRDLADATSLQLSPLISVRVIRGCWILYEKPDFQGRSIALEEGCLELTNVWADPGLETEPQEKPPMLIGSIRLAVWDYSVPHIDLFTEPEGHGRMTPYHDDTIETGSFGIPLSTASILVHSGVWLVFSDPGFQGMLAVLEKGEYPVPESWGFPNPFVGSLRPLKMAGFKVENPHEVKAVIYEKPGLCGSCLEIDGDVYSFDELEGDTAKDGHSKKLQSVGSLKIIGGLWVGYGQPGFEGQQHILEEGEYLDYNDWGGGPDQLLSLRPILGDFKVPHLKMFSDRDFGSRGVNIDVTVPVFNMEDTGYGLKTQSIDVIGGVWVVFEEMGFCGEPYILERGLYGSFEDWGALLPRVASAMPVVLDDFDNCAKFKVQLFSDPGFQGSVLTLEDTVDSLQDGFSVGSCKVLAGSWLAFEGPDLTGRMYVLEMGSYPDLKAMGYTHASAAILSLETVGFEFSLPSITLFERCGLRGKRVVQTDGAVNLQLAGGCCRVQSVLVEGGMWVLYEGINYRGAQILLKPGEIPEWRKFSSWQKIGSLRPLMQSQVHFRLRNRDSGLLMSLVGDLDDIKLMRINEMEDTGGFEQIWLFENGHLRCRMLEECHLCPSGSLTMAGSRLGLASEPSTQDPLWSITPDGFIRHTATADLVLEVKGGHNYDKNQIILNTIDLHKPNQRWSVEIL
ncbi:uncharacterized protein LOC143012287 isoform X2 [Genypterus blacodes]|uniref:uncharacterized protein LOC143012287 isoform X2 n=1 Tax=Genypterus blacodes TaxID=154954 RepID=UPI003F76EF5B